jgi:hypothetical protein
LSPHKSARAGTRAAPAAVRACTASDLGAELRIYPPGQYRATYAAFDLEACSHAGPIYLGVEPVQPGVGTING